MWPALFLVDRALSIPSLPFSNSPGGFHYSGSGPGGGSDNGGETPISQWSSTIGIVTAIVGNVLISFALNIQRYAHIRLARDLEKKRMQEGWKQAVLGSRLSHNRTSSIYGTLNCSNEGRVQQSMDEPAHDTTNENVRSLVRDSSSDDGNDYLQQSVLSEQTVASLEKNAEYGEPQSYLRSPYWWTGIILMAIGEAGNFLAYGFAPASIVSPLGVVALVSNCLIAPFMLKERFRRRDFFGVLIAIGGAVTVVLSANTSEGKIGPDDILGMVTRWEFELYLGITIGLIIILMCISKRYGRRTILIDLGLVGLFGGYTALSTKGVSSLLSYTLWHVITFPITYALVAVLVVSAMMQIRYINRALQRFDSTQVIPTQFVLFTISVILGSAILYRDFESATMKQAFEFVGGCALTFLAVYLITSGRSSGEDDQDIDHDEEEVIGLLHGTRYHDSFDCQGQGSACIDRRTDGAGTVEVHGGSCRDSLLCDHQVNDEETEELHTPRAPFSSSPMSLPPSMSDASLLEPPPGSSEERFTQPWIQDGECLSRAVSIDRHPSIPHIPSSSITLQFPTAPGVADSPGEAANDRDYVLSRRHTLSRMPRSSSRSRLSLRFSPGPLLTPLSGGLSAVVADSLRRGQVSPKKSKDRRRRRKRMISTTDGIDRDTEYETDSSFVGGQEEHCSEDFLRTSSLGTTLPFRPPSAPNGYTMPRAGGQTTDSTPRPSRGRKGSWTDNLSRFGASLRLSSRRLGRIFIDDENDRLHQPDGTTDRTNVQTS
ncbi:hypothetical protein LOZ53_004787 [Ophidiomyces ophidiicola]|nr:hypothetical protein LOZ55_002331 [Ophidiomyces ophidiicola]KAI1981182.1 hypothetical protein LOZ54_005672 [Ophidiomyces ophidiicola]KAI1986227.1 hypothetical protein LOZ53_004787 [Ophidiomyces ophidiicola]KAI2001173.1 hypothetical protein LOZ51_001465 [Ophidiomyces ophidiicola]